MSVQMRIVSAAEASATHRSAVPDEAVRQQAYAICADIRVAGDEALTDAGRRFGGSRQILRVPVEEMATAWSSISAELRSAIETAAANIRSFHVAQQPVELTHEPVPGVRIDRRWSPLRRVGVYVPGGRAAYPSSLMMGVVPAQAAGVAEVVVASPSGPDGELSEALLATAHYLGVTEMYTMGGAQAVAALAYGTETIDRVDKIVGPGNAWVTAAKLAVLGECGIDMPAGPSEVLVVADHTADPTMVAVDLLCQAEHGPDSPAVLVTTEQDLIDSVSTELNRLLPTLERSEILAQALDNHGLMVLTESLDESISLANRYAAEHVTVLTEYAEADAERITAAGSIYVGHWSPESAGDYATGANHILPTGGLARSMNPLSIDDFGTWRQVQTMTEEGLVALAPTICELATAEGLTAHRLSAEIRLGSGPERA